MKIKSISVGGFKNLKRSTIQLENITAVISPNNYGKSNLLEAIDFGVDFLSSNSKDRKTMMKWIRGIPINKTIENDEFFFEVELEDELLGDYQFIRYGYKFSWFRDDGNGQKILLLRSQDRLHRKPSPLRSVRNRDVPRQRKLAESVRGI